MFNKTKKSLIALLAAIIAAALLCVGVSLLSPKTQKAYAVSGVGDVVQVKASTTKSYATFDDAITDIGNISNGNVEIKLLGNATATKELSSGNNAKYFTLDLNGHVLTVGKPIRCARLTLKDSMAGTTDSAYLHEISNPTTEDMTDTVQIYGGVLTNPTGYALSVGYSYVVTMESGTIAGCASTDDGGGVYVYGGDFSMTGGTICGNNTTDFRGGAGVYVLDGTFDMNGTAKISGNTATNYGGGVYVYSGTFNMSDTATIDGNTAKYGGGVYVLDGTFNMSGAATISGNTATNSAGGVGTSSSGCTFNLTGGSITNNTALNNGGGVHTNGTFNMKKSADSEDAIIISGNKTTSTTLGDGGGVRVSSGAFNMSYGVICGNSSGNTGGGVSVGNGSTFTMTGGTIGGTTEEEANTAQSGGGVYLYSGEFNMSGTAKITGNTAKYGGVYVGNSGTFNVSGPVNITGNTNGEVASNVCGTYTNTVVGVLDESARISFYYSGNVAKMAAGATFNAQNFIADREGYIVTTYTGGSDGDAYTGIKVVQPAASVTAGGVTTGYATFAEAWAAANNAGTATVTMRTGALVTEMLVVAEAANITLEMQKNKLELTGDSDSVIRVNGVLTVQQGNVVEGLTASYEITDPVSGNVVTIDNSLITGGKNHGVYVGGKGKFILGGNVVIAGNNAQTFGGGVYVDGEFKMESGASVSYNQSGNSGGGVYVSSSGKFTMSGGRIACNKSGDGGGVYTYGNFNMNGNAEIVDNTATKNGGGLYVDSWMNSASTLSGGSIKGNTAAINGGGVYVPVDKFKISGAVTVTDNKKGDAADDVYLTSGKKITVSGALSDGANIGVKLSSDYSGAFTSGYGANNSGIFPYVYFNSDDENNSCVYLNTDSEVCIGAHNYVNGVCTNNCRPKAQIYWGISEGKLLISGVSGTVATNSFDYDAVFGYYDSAPWYNDRASITSVEFDGENGVVPVSLKYWFNGCSELTNIDLLGLNTSYVTDMFGMFGGCTKLASLDLSGFDTAKVTDMSDMFFQCSVLISLDLSAFDFTNVTNMRCMFRSCTALAEIIFPTEVNAQKVTAVDYMFENCKGMTSVDLSAFKTSELTNMSRMFSGCSKLTSVTFPASFDTAKVTNMSQLFQSCTALTSPGISGFNTESVTTMENLFADCAGLTSVNLANWNVQNVINMKSTFNGCANLTEVTFPTVFNTAKVTHMTFLFSRCGALKKIDLSSFKTDSLTVMEGMFYTCGALEEVNLSSFDAQNVTSANYMFYGCNALNKVIAPAKIGASFSTALPSTKFWNGAADITYIDGTGAGKTFVKHDGHSLTAVAQKNATCTEAGVLAHDHCSICGKNFIENVEKSAEQLAIAKTAHEWETEFTVDKAATCTESGSKSKHCKHCDSKTEVTEIPAAHHLTHHGKVDATTEKAGNNEYWSCADCDKYFSDSEGATEIADKSSVIIPKLAPEVPTTPAGGQDKKSYAWICWLLIPLAVAAGGIACGIYLYKKNKMR